VGEGVQIVVPGLFDLPLEELEPGFVVDRLPALNRILGLSTTHATQDYSIDAMLCGALGLPSTLLPSGSSQHGLPMAQAFADDNDDPARLLLVEAIHLRADMHSAVAVPIPDNSENNQDITILIKDLCELFDVDCDVKSVTHRQYLLRLKQFDAPLHYPHPLSVLGKSISPFIEQSRAVLPWYQLINEFQMFLHQHPLNQRRVQQGRLPINSLWAWGAGTAPDLPPDPLPDWYCDDDLLNQFTSSLGLQVRACSGLAGSHEMRHAVIVDLRLIQLLKSGLECNLDELLLDLERNLFAPILQKLSENPVPLMLRAGYRVDFEFKPLARFKFWRRPGSLEDWRQPES
jgi:hypothetical protein